MDEQEEGQDDGLPLSATEVGIRRLMLQHSNTRYVEYLCQSKKCKGTDNQYPARDFLKLGAGEKPVGVVNCWSCRYGFGIDLQTSLANKAGMIPAVISETGIVLELSADEHTELIERRFQEAQDKRRVLNTVTPLVPSVVNPATAAALRSLKKNRR